MAPLKLRLAHRRLIAGCAAGLDEPTALVVVEVDGRLDGDAVARVRAGLPLLCPEEPLFGVDESDWPAAFLTAARPDPGEQEALGRWAVALTVALQRWTRDPVWRGRVVDSDRDLLRLAIPWWREGVFDDALRVALALLELWSQPANDRQRTVGEAIAAGIDAARRDGLPPLTLRCIQAAVERRIPFEVLPNCVRFGWGHNAERMDQTFTTQTSYIAATSARDKMQTARILTAAGIPVPKGEAVTDADRALQVATGLGWPVVIKPADQEQGRGVVVNIADEAALRAAFDAAAQQGAGNVIVQQHIAGEDHRLLMVRGRLLAAARRLPGGVTGDGVHSVAELLDQLNADPRRGHNEYSQMKRIGLDTEALECLAELGMRADSVPAAGQRVVLRRIANVSAGGTAQDVTALVHPDNLALAQRAARQVGLDIAGIDFLTPDISRSWREAGGAICEVNAQPGLRPHWLADPDRDINGELMDIIFQRRPARIPTAAITGTHGKSATALMLHHIWTAAGVLTGVCTAQAVWIGEEVISTGDLSGFPGARMILNDPATQAGVFEISLKGLIDTGHPCDRYDVAALLNVSDDHIGVHGVETPDQMAELTAEVLARARDAVVVNAEDRLCMAMRARAGADRHILVAREPAAVTGHRRGGGEAVVLSRRGEAPWITLCSGEAEVPLICSHDIPATTDGLLRFDEADAMFAAALAWSQGIDPEVIAGALSSFANAVEQNPEHHS